MPDDITDEFVFMAGDEKLAKFELMRTGEKAGVGANSSELWGG